MLQLIGDKFFILQFLQNGFPRHRVGLAPAELEHPWDNLIPVTGVWRQVAPAA
jgi:hypothetical protein